MAHTPITEERERIERLILRAANAFVANDDAAYDQAADEIQRRCAINLELIHQLEIAEQNVRNLGVGFLTGDAKEMASQTAANMRAALAAAKGPR